MRRLVPLETDDAGCAKTILAGYFKFGVATLLGGTFGTGGTSVLIYEEDSD